MITKERICADIPNKFVPIAKQALRDVLTLVEKNKVYGESWKRRGGQGAWFTIVRPWDRLEQMVEQSGNDIFAAGDYAPSDKDSDILDSIRDIRNYLFLVEQEIILRRQEQEREGSYDFAVSDGSPTPFGFSPEEALED